MIKFLILAFDTSYSKRKLEFGVFPIFSKACLNNLMVLYPEEN